MDDAGVYLLTPDIALVQTVDFFTPMVDDPYTFGQVAAANSLSDVYAMGAKPLTALNVTTFPVNDMDLGILREILAGGADKLKEAGALLMGGHTVEDDVPKFGLAVTGTVHPDEVWANRGAKPGDKLILTKPIGVGIISTAIKGELASPEEEQAAVKTMITLNKAAADAAQGLEVHACTDITGFGLLGHAKEMVDGSQVSFVIDWSKVPVLNGTREYAAMGVVPGGAWRNLQYIAEQVVWKGNIGAEDRDILCDPQTSGGLLLAMTEKDTEIYLTRLEQKGEKGYLIGHVEQKNAGKIIVRGE